jgi:hypothetical protein
MRGGLGFAVWRGVKRGGGAGEERGGARQRREDHGLTPLSCEEDDRRGKEKIEGVQAWWWAGLVDGKRPEERGEKRVQGGVAVRGFSLLFLKTVLKIGLKLVFNISKIIIFSVWKKTRKKGGFK